MQRSPGYLFATALIAFSVSGSVDVGTAEGAGRGPALPAQREAATATASQDTRSVAGSKRTTESRKRATRKARRPATGRRRSGRSRTRAGKTVTAGLTLSVTAAAPGTSVKVTGSGYPRRTNGSLNLGNVRLAGVKSPRTGTISATFTVPTDAPVGTSNVVAVVGGATGTAPLRILATAGTPAPTPTATPTATPTPTPTPTTTVTTASNPLAGLQLYVDPNSRAKQQADLWRSSRPADAAQMDKIAARSQADWFGDWNPDVQAEISQRVTTVTSAGAVPVLVLYNIPQRDCGLYSAGGASSATAYQTWIRAAAAGIGDRKAAVVLEPDAVANADCLNDVDRTRRFDLLKDAVSTLEARRGVSVYLDSGNSNWHSASTMAARLKLAGVEMAQGVSLNVSAFRYTAETIAYGTDLSALIGGKHFVVDTSRNGLGAYGNEWCNPSGRAVGPSPTVSTGHALVDAYLWVKRPGESDGTCNGGPSAGHWWPEYGLGLAQRASF